MNACSRMNDAISGGGGEAQPALQREGTRGREGVNRRELGMSAGGSAT